MIRCHASSCGWWGHEHGGQQLMHGFKAAGLGLLLHRRVLGREHGSDGKHQRYRVEGMKFLSEKAVFRIIVATLILGTAYRLCPILPGQTAVRFRGHRA